MDELQNLQPGKIKRKNRRSQSESFMQLPELSTQSNHFDDPLLDQSNDRLSLNAVEAASNDQFSDALLDDLLKSSTDIALENAAAAETPARALSIEHIEATSTDDSTHEADGDSTNNNGLIDENKSVSPLDLLNAPTAAPQRDDIRKLTPSRRPKQAQNTSTPLNVAASPVPEAVETTIQRATHAADKTLDALARLEAATDRAERRHFFNSAVAYILFCVILALGLYFALNYKAASKYAFNAANQEKFEKLLSEKKILDDVFEKDQRASSEAYEVYQLIEQGRYEESIERYVKIRADLTHPAESALLEQKIDTIRWKLADNAYHDGIVLYRDENLEQARDAFFKSLSYKENTAYTDTLHYYLAMSLYQLGDYEGARAYFEKAMQGQLGTEMDANARYFRAISAEKVGDEVEAYSLFDQFLRKYKNHKYSDDAIKRRAKHEKAAKTN